MGKCEISSSSLQLCLSEETHGWTLLDRRTDGRLLITDSQALMTPVIDGQRAKVHFEPGRQSEDGVTLNGNVEGIGKLVLEIFARAEDAIDIRCSLTPEHHVQLNALELFPEGTAVVMDDVINFRNRTHTSKTWPELLLGGRGCSTTTYSNDWQFAPHPSMLMLRKMDSILFAGCMDLPCGAFGMELAAAEHRLSHWRIQYGAHPHGLPLAAGQTFASPAIRIFLRRCSDIYQILDEFAAMLVQLGRIPDPAGKTRLPWWCEPVYCTWTDQNFAAEVTPPADLREQAMQGNNGPAQRILTESFVRHAAETILREKLPLRTILIDDGWQVARGQWEPESTRFPDFRGLVDDLHAMGFKVVVWWNWAEVEAAAQVDPAHLMAHGKLNHHGCRVRDYSMPRVQEEYFRPLFRKMFSSDAGCYDLDGVKTDFLADKVHPELPPFDPSWRGEENYFRKMTELFYREMKSHKPDAVHIGCAGHFWLAEHIDINRTYDIWLNQLEHETRAKMLKHTSPGVPVVYDLCNFMDGLDVYFDSAERMNAPVHIGNVLYLRDDPFAPPRPAGVSYYELLRKRLGRFALDAIRR